jgi:hypothetical protein
MKSAISNYSHFQFIIANLIVFFPISFMSFIQVFLPQRIIPASEYTLHANNQAIRRGYPAVLVRTMLSYQHLTVCTMTTTTLYLMITAFYYYSNDGRYLISSLCYLRLILPGACLVVAQYWTFVLIFDPWTLVPREDFPKDNSKANSMANRIFLYPSISMYLPFHLLIQLQHSWMPVLLWVEVYLFSQDVSKLCSLPSALEEVTASLTYLLTWLIWGMGCWYVRGRPPYPLLRTVWNNKWWKALYPAMAVLGVVGALAYHEFQKVVMSS